MGTNHQEADCGDLDYGKVYDKIGVSLKDNRLVTPRGKSGQQRTR